jgi:glycosyltransferase involved in cell wall biosynthesis
MNRRVLFVSYYFPPIGGIGSIRATAMANYLPEFGWDPVVLAPSGTPHPTDSELRYPKSAVVRARSIELSRAGRLFAGSERSEPSRKGRSPRDVARAAAHRYLFYPDPQVGWYPAAVLAGWRKLRAGRFDAIYSSALPVTAHLVARTLSRRARIPWVAEFRDPWSDLDFPTGPHRQRAARLEERLAKTATRVVMPTPTWASYFGDRWGREVAVVRNGFDQRIDPRPPPDEPVLTYLGTLNPQNQTLAPLWEGLARLVRGGYHPVPKVRIVGELTPAIQAEAARVGLDRLLEATGFVSHERAMAELSTSSALIASSSADAGPLGSGVVPAKIYEYLATSLPIVLLGDARSDPGALIAPQPGCHVVDFADIDGIADAIREVLTSGPLCRDVEAFSRRAAARTLAAVLDDATSA